MQINSNTVINAWRMAAKDLNIRIQAPYIIIENEIILEFPLLIESFGNKNGTLIRDLEDHDSLTTHNVQGFYVALLNYESYSVYNRERFTGTLNDWGYFGDEKSKPGWYTGKPWTR